MSTLAKQLNLPEGWTATRFIQTVTLEHFDGRKTHLPVPYDLMTREQWEEAAAKAIDQCPLYVHTRP
jgi:hypothetical protein